MLSKFKTKEQFAQALGLSFQKHVVYYLYRMPPAQKYKQFEIKKRSGGKRPISAPHYGLKRLQQRVAKLLTDAYGNRPPVHGYVPGRSTKTNAEAHVRQTFVLNIDLENFFGSMNFGRVRGILMSGIYGANEEVATIIAQIACFDNTLPQGAPTSPILSNMICGALDADLKRFARTYRCTYTRYSDDITLSCNTKSFPATVAHVQGSGEDRLVVVGEELNAIVAKHGFRLNNAKSRLLSKSDRQEVTGLVVNRFVNVPRKYIRNIWAALHAWRKFGFDAASARFKERFDFHTRDEADFESVMMGRIQYVGSVRGFEDEIYLKLRRTFNQLSSKNIPAHGSTWEHDLDLAVWVVEHCYDEPGKKEPTCGQGTAFFLEGYGLVTCAHCLAPTGNTAFNPNNPKAQFDVEIIAKDDDLDLAVIQLIGHDGATVPSLAPSADSNHVERRDRITLVGWPQWGPGSTLSIKEGQIQSIKDWAGIRRFNLSTAIVEGNSGGPIFNIRRQVVGVAATGRRNPRDEVEAHGAIPIHALSFLK
jgi:RNA-directed DNA polymerase